MTTQSLERRRRSFDPERAARTGEELSHSRTDGAPRNSQSTPADRIKHEPKEEDTSAASTGAQQDTPADAPRIKRERDDSLFGQEDGCVVELMDDDEEEDESIAVDEDDYGSENDEPAITEEIEPDYTRANKIKFCELVDRLEHLWMERSKRYWTKEQKLEYLLPKQLLVTLKGGSPYPILRLMMPKIDTSRPHFGMLESSIINAWKGALGLGNNHTLYKKLKEYRNPEFNPNGAGDLSVAVYEVARDCGLCLPENKPKDPNKKIKYVKIGEINDYLDELVSIKKKATLGHEWRNDGDNARRSQNATLKQLREHWVSKLLGKLTPLEHKWVVRILMLQVEFGVGYKSILKYYSPYAEELYNGNNSLKRLCTTLSNPDWVKEREERARKDELENAEDVRRNHMPRCNAKASLGKCLTPMLANKTSFETALSDITFRHRNFAAEMPDEETGADSLALKFPTFVCEVKLDGERIVTHVNRGIVTMQTRNSKWYSTQYCPVLGPGIRRAITRYDVDVILDGEVIAWDNARKEIIPFGINRTIANVRRKFLAQHNRLDERDMDLHANEVDINVVPPGAQPGGRGPNDEPEAGADCWLKYIVFDILYVGGPDAAKLIKEATGAKGAVDTGSILSLDGFDRKKILYRLIDQQEEVEMVPSLVIRCNGRYENATEYFSPTNPSMEAGYPCSKVDSIECALGGEIAEREAVDAQLRRSKNDIEISNRRAEALNQFYVDIVENRAMEGLVLKDLAAPYFLGECSRQLRYWHKLKPDYCSKDRAASDIDAIVLGAFYATGLRHSGVLNSFLIGCVDSNNPGTFMPLCKVNGGGTARSKLDSLLRHTGFQPAQDGQPTSYGKWFKERNYALPDFVSKRSFQQGSEGKGWRFQRTKHYPDFWIHPNDSVVLTINAGEIITSDDFSAGVTLRFPRIVKVRVEGGDGDEKPADECETVDALHQLYRQMAQLKEGSGTVEFQFGSPSRLNSQGTNTRFLTVEENTRRKKSNRRGTATSTDRTSEMPTVEKKESDALAGLTFWVLDGRYSFDADSLDAEQAKVEGWVAEARKVKEKRDVQEFILKHGGTCKFGFSMDADFIVGGRVGDPRSQMIKRSLEYGSRAIKANATTKKDLELKKLIELGGVLKWTAIFSLVHRLINGMEKVKVEAGAEMSAVAVTASRIQLLRPCRHDFLVLCESVQLDTDSEVFDIPLTKDISFLEFRRGLEEVARRRQTHVSKRTKLGGAFVPWQVAAVQSLPASERWVLAGTLEKLWIHRSMDNAESFPMIIYPDVFDDDFGLRRNEDALQETISGVPSTRWNDVKSEVQRGPLASTIPLANTMGAQVTPHLHDGVTHIICNLRDCDRVEWSPQAFLPENFENHEHAVKVHRRLQDLHQNSINGTGPVAFVNPSWIRKKFITFPSS